MYGPADEFTDTIYPVRVTAEEITAETQRIVDGLRRLSDKDQTRAMVGMIRDEFGFSSLTPWPIRREAIVQVLSRRPAVSPEIK